MSYSINIGAKCLQVSRNSFNQPCLEPSREVLAWLKANDINCKFTIGKRTEYAMVIFEKAEHLVLWKLTWQ